jgi:transcription antitermination factor NusG
MWTDDQPMKWYAAAVHSKHERAVQQLIADKGYETFVPWQTVLRRWSDRQKRIEQPLFPGYVFCRLRVAGGRLAAQPAPVVTTPGVLRMIGAGGVPLPIEDHEMASLQAVQESGLRNTSWPYLREGQRVELVDGPLRGTQGFLSSVREEDHLVISVTLLQRSIAVRVRRDWIRPL